MPQLKASLTALGNRALATVPPSAIRAIDTQLSAIPGIIKLTLGEPDFAVPAHVKAAAAQAIADDWSHYAPSFGYLSLRTAIADYLRDRYQAHYDPAGEVVVTVGATEGIHAAIAGLFNPGDTLIIPTPAFPLYEAVARIAGLNVVLVNTAPDYVLTAAALTATLAAHPDARGVVLNYPSNPTGATYTEPQLRALAAVLADSDLVVLSDEIYAELTYDAPHLSLGALLPEQTVLISGLSKSHAMTGYRLGYLAGPAPLIALVGKMHQFMVTSAASPMMKAAEAALIDGRADAAAMRDVYRTRRDLMLTALTACGFTAPQPAGAFYIFAQLPPQFGQDDVAFVLQLGHEAGVGLVPGSVFGPGGAGHVRLSYAASTDALREAAARIQRFVRAHQE